VAAREPHYARPTAGAGRASPTAGTAHWLRRRLRATTEPDQQIERRLTSSPRSEPMTSPSLPLPPAPPTATSSAPPRTPPPLLDWDSRVRLPIEGGTCAEEEPLSPLPPVRVQVASHCEARGPRPSTVLRGPQQRSTHIVASAAEATLGFGQERDLQKPVAVGLSGSGLSVVKSDQSRWSDFDAVSSPGTSCVASVSGATLDAGQERDLPKSVAASLLGSGLGGVQSAQSRWSDFDAVSSPGASCVASASGETLGAGQERDLPKSVAVSLWGSGLGGSKSQLPRWSDFSAASQDVTSPVAGGVPPHTSWTQVPAVRAKVLRVLDEMDEYYRRHRSPGDRWIPSTPLGAADCAEELKQYLMLHRPHGAGDWHRVLSAVPELWRRVRMEKLRHHGLRQHYLVIYSLDMLHRHLVLHVPVGEFDLRHAERQATYRDDRHGRFAPGLRVDDSLLEFLKPDEREFGELYRDGGYPFTFTDVPAASRTPNYYSYDVEFAERSVRDLTRQVERGYVEGPLLYTPRIVNPQGGVYNEAKDKYRPVLDATASRLNESIVPLECDFVSLADVVKPHTEDCWMSGLDLKDAFYMWPRSQHHCDLLGLHGPPGLPEYYRYRFSAMGVSDSPAIQSKWALILQRMLNDEAISPVARQQRDAAPERLEAASAAVAGFYVDDSHHVHSAAYTWAEANDQFEQAVAFLRRHGVEDSEAKREAPKRVKDFVGFEVDTTTMTVRVQPKRRELYRQTVVEFAAAHVNTAPRVALAALLGKLQFCAPVVRQLPVLLAPLYRACCDLSLVDANEKNAWGRRVVVPMSAEAADALARIAVLLSDEAACERRIYSEPTLPLRYSGFWTGETPDDIHSLLATSFTATGIPVYTGDASGDGGGAHHLHHRMAWKYADAQCAPNESSNFRELDTAVRPIEGPWAEAWAGGRVLNLSDNSTTVAVINRRGSMVPKLASMSERLQARCASLDIDLASRHVPGVLNTLADGLSRVQRPLDRGDYQFSPSEFHRIDALLGHLYGEGSSAPFHTLDGCCDVAGNNRLTEHFCSPLESVLQRPLRGERLWANPDFEAGFLGSVLRHFIAEYRAAPSITAGTFVVPVWLHCSWWRHLKGARVVAVYRAGSRLFTSPDWRALRRTDGTYGYATTRVDRGPTRWDVLVAHFPMAGCRRIGGGGGTPPRDRAAAARLARPPMLCLHGDAAFDAGLLHSVQPSALR